MSKFKITIFFILGILLGIAIVGIVYLRLNSAGKENRAGGGVETSEKDEADSSTTEDGEEIKQITKMTFDSNYDDDKETHVLEQVGAGKNKYFIAKIFRECCDDENLLWHSENFDGDEVAIERKNLNKKGGISGILISEGWTKSVVWHIITFQQGEEKYIELPLINVQGEEERMEGFPSPDENTKSETKIPGDGTLEILHYYNLRGYGGEVAYRVVNAYKLEEYRFVFVSSEKEYL